MAIKSIDRAKGIYFYKSPVSTVSDKKCPLEFFVPRFKYFETTFTNYIAESKNEKDSTTRAAFNVRCFTVADTGISSRVMTNWAKFGVLPEGIKDDNSWKKFSFVELVWIRAVYHMRDFGLSLKEIATVRSWVMEWDKKNKDYPWFEYYVRRAKRTSDDPYIVILPGGIAELATAHDIDAHREYAGYVPDNPHMLLISLKLLLKELGLTVESDRPLKELTNKEREVFNEIRRAGSKEVVVGIGKEGIKDITTSRVYGVTKDQTVSDIMKQINEGQGFGDIEIKYENMKPQSVRVRKKKRLK